MVKAKERKAKSDRIDAMRRRTRRKTGVTREKGGRHQSGEHGCGWRWQILGVPSAGNPLYADFKSSPAFRPKPAAQRHGNRRRRQTTLSKNKSFCRENFAHLFSSSRKFLRGLSFPRGCMASCHGTSRRTYCGGRDLLHYAHGCGFSVFWERTLCLRTYSMLL